MHDVVCERAFLPDTHDMTEFARTGTELFSLESKRPLNRFDIVAFSVSFENDYPNIAKILGLGHIPMASTERTPSHPLLIMGGACAFFNPEPLADFFDICFIGDAEEMLPEFLDIYRSARSRKLILERALAVEGLYVPKYYTVSYNEEGRMTGRRVLPPAPEKVTRRCFNDLSQSTIRTSIVTSETEFSDMYLIEAMRGCPWNCRFCVTSSMYNPPRKKNFETIRDEIAGASDKTARIGLVGPSLSDHAQILEVLALPNVDFSITSLRANARSAELVSLMKGHRSVSIAPEAGTPRLREVINKKITEHDILRTSDLLFAQGIQTLRLYFMVGLPTETGEDIEGILSLTKKIRGITTRGTLTLSISTFVPKPFTPFQWHPMEKLATVKQRLKQIKQGLKTLKGVRIFHDIPKYAYLQGVFSLGDRHLSKVLRRSTKDDNWPRPAEWSRLRKDSPLFRHRTFEEQLPWDFIDMGRAKKDLWDDYQKALSTADKK
jgi:radical SAM superfamily enzyme YgiQ (UPF0313 family)